MHDRQRNVSITNDAPGGGPGVVVVVPSCTVNVYGHNAVVVLMGGLRTHTELQSNALAGNRLYLRERLLG
jgi:hypothetical protein